MSRGGGRCGAGTAKGKGKGRNQKTISRQRNSQKNQRRINRTENHCTNFHFTSHILSLSLSLSVSLSLSRSHYKQKSLNIFSVSVGSCVLHCVALRCVCCAGLVFLGCDVTCQKHNVIEELEEHLVRKNNPRRSKRAFGPLTPSSERPLVLPGGRRWYRPKDAYNDEFIAETLSAQAELITGSTLGWVLHEIFY